jgi:voltage-gated potassium channel
VWEQLPSGRVVHRFEWVVLVAALAIVPVLVVEADASSGDWRTFATVANWIIWGIFLGELAFVLTVAPRKAAALRAHWLDVAIVVLTVPVFGRLLSSLRLVRLARLLRLLRLGVILGRAVQAERAVTSGDALRFAALITVIVVVVSGSAQAVVDTGDFDSVWDGIWWAVVTVTTVGYGDIYPHTTPGRIVAIVVMFVGIGFLSVLTAAIASRFVKTERGSEYDEMMDSLGRIEAELAGLRQQLGAGAAGPK